MRCSIIEFQCTLDAMFGEHFALYTEHVAYSAFCIMHCALDATCAEVTGQWSRSGSKDYDQWLAPRHDYIMSTRHALNNTGDMCLTQM